MSLLEELADLGDLVAGLVEEMSDLVEEKSAGRQKMYTIPGRRPPLPTRRLSREETEIRALRLQVSAFNTEIGRLLSENRELKKELSDGRNGRKRKDQ